MAKRKKRISTRKTTATKKTKTEEEQPSTSVEEESINTTGDTTPPAVEKTVPRDDELISTEECASLPEATNSKEQLPSAECDLVVNLSENIIQNEESLAPGDPGEFIFAPIVRRSEEANSTVDLCTPAPTQSCSTSTSTSEKVISLVSSKGASKNQNSGDGSSACEISHTQTIEVIDVDELPDTPCSSIGDDVIEITPGHSSRSSRSNSPEIIVSRQIVDLTEISVLDNVNEPENNPEGEGEFLPPPLSSKKHKEKRQPTVVPAKSDVPEPPRQKLHCPICMDDFSLIVKDRRLMSTSCGHVFCDVCLKAAVDVQKRCPTCRKKQSMKNLHPIFL